MRYDFTDKVVAVTGGASFGMGNYMARTFFAANAKVAICSRRKDKLDESVASLAKADSNRIFGMQADMTDPDQAIKFIEETIKHYGKIDILVNNAGVFVPKPAVEVTVEDYDNQFNTKPRGYFFTAQTAVKDMMKRKQSGCIINIGSVNAVCKTLNNAVYAAANAAVAHFTECLAREWGPYKIRVNCIQPGSIRTEINYEKYTEHPELEADMNTKLALGHRGDPKYIADAALFLASEDAEYITGDCLTVDGGFLLYSL